MKIGDTSVCASCGKPIQFKGSWWEHTTYSPRHIAVPEQFTAPKPDGPDSRERDAIERFQKFIDRMGQGGRDMSAEEYSNFLFLCRHAASVWKSEFQSRLDLRASDAENERLTKMLRDTGYGQGQIDAAQQEGK